MITTMKNLFKEINNGTWTTSGIDVQYRIENGEEIKLVFQSTVSISDWIHDFMFSPKKRIQPYKNQKVVWYAHEGFTKLWKSVQDEVIQKVILLAGTKKNIFVTGFSLGGALATLAYEDLVFRLGGNERVKGIVFGCPRVIWFPPKIIKKRFANFVRYKNGGDIVTNFPFTIFGYRHVGSVVNVGKWQLPSPRHHFLNEYIENL